MSITIQGVTRNIWDDASILPSQVEKGSNKSIWDTPFGELTKALTEEAIATLLLWEENERGYALSAQQLRDNKGSATVHRQRVYFKRGMLRAEEDWEWLHSDEED